MRERERQTDSGGGGDGGREGEKERRHTVEMGEGREGDKAGRWQREGGGKEKEREGDREFSKIVKSKCGPSVPQAITVHPDFDVHPQRPTCFIPSVDYPTSRLCLVM